MEKNIDSEIKKKEKKEKDKRLILLSIGVILMSAVVYMTSSVPRYDIEALNSISTPTKYNPDVLTGNTAILFESSTCPYCQAFVKEITSNEIIWKKLLGMNLIVMTDKIPDVPQFRDCHVIVGKDIEPHMKKYGIIGVPTLVITGVRDNGEVRYEKYEGYMNESVLMDILDRY